MLRINIVYQNKNMPGDVLPPIEAPDGSYTVVWSRLPQSDADAVVYFNEYVFDRRLHHKICPDARKILYMYEPPAIDPMQYTKRVWRQFDHVLTWNTYLTESSAAFTFEAGAYYNLPYCSDYGVDPIEGDINPSARERAVVQVCGDKYSLSAEEIYSERRKVACWFHENARTRMDVFGRPPMDAPNYRGECDDKAETMSRYRYALCFENTFHPLWTRGYLTEKILDCMAAGTIPVYYGCSNIEELVPLDCFIDYRQFHSTSGREAGTERQQRNEVKWQTLEELDSFLQGMTDEEYIGYTKRMRQFVAEYNAPVRHSVERLYETVASVCSRPIPDVVEYPEDYLQVSSLNGKLRLLAMRILLPYHRYIYPAFALARWVRKKVAS